MYRRFGCVGCREGRERVLHRPHGELEFQSDRSLRRPQPGLISDESVLHVVEIACTVWKEDTYGICNKRQWLARNDTYVSS